MCSCLASPSTVRQPIGEFGPVCRLAKAKAWPLAKNGESMAISKKWVGDDDGEEVAMTNDSELWPRRCNAKVATTGMRPHLGGQV